MKLGTVMKCYKQIQLPQKAINLIKNLTSKWLCQDMRAFSIVKDTGLRNLLQEFIILTDEYRTILKGILKEPYENRCICICPDLWPDSYKQISYMGISISFVDKDCNYKSLDLCCRPYMESDHSDANILVSIQRCLMPFDLIDFDQLHFASDRGANLVRALRNYDTLFCYPHRLNNILKRAFFQSKSNKEQQTKTSSTLACTSLISNTTVTNEIDQENEDNVYSSSSTDNEDDKVEPTLPINNKLRKMKFEDLTLAAQEIIKTVTRCKKLVEFVKRSGCNKDIQSFGGIALQQSTVVRWLSLINLLESIVLSYKVTKRVLINRKQQMKLKGIDEKVLKQIIRLLKPFKQVLKIIQTTNTPSLYMVLICTHKLRKTLSSFDELTNYHSPLSTNSSSDIENDIHEEIDMTENEGMKILRMRILALLNLTFELDIRHYCATLLHARYRQLKRCTKDKHDQTYKYIRKRMSEIIKVNQEKDIQPPQKKIKSQQSFLQQYEDNSDPERCFDECDTSGSEDYAFITPKADELSRYLSMDIDKSSLTDNPLDFWRKNQSVSRYCQN
ncbi:unnamed protein product [Rotaria socialis]|uniref:Uncharacterized protein n=1 Tax=Rotaria socialis TaxID=392032 RepID=A0A820ZI66_9BILA|nr:unnamed protein product [Rotaria socialis]